jgi:predicted CXXCH cytochrome family protein
MEPHRLVDVRREDFCRSCHKPGAQAGAPVMVLPSKGVLCLPCHAAILSWGGWPSRVGLALFLVGLVAALAFWLSGGRGDTLTLTPPASSPGQGPGWGCRLGAGLKALLADGLLQRRLWRLSPWRGLIHGLIFWPMALRFSWGLMSLLLGLWLPGSSWTGFMLSKNQPVTALFFDLTGLMMLTGGAAAMLRCLVQGRGKGQARYGQSGWPVLALLAGMILSGFATEAVRMAMTGWPPGSGFAFLGFALGRLLPPGGWSMTAYGWLWYAHAGLTAAFMACLPFSRMFHIILAPAVLALRAAGRREPRRERP